MSMMGSQAFRLSVVAAGCFAAGLWIGSQERAAAQPGATSAGARPSQEMRYMLESGSDSMCMIDTWTGETWTLAPAGTDGEKLHHWTKLTNTYLRR